MQQKFIVLGIEQESKYEKGDIVEKLWVHYFKPDLSDTRLFKGFNITKIDVRGVLSVEDFEQSSGLYSFQYSIVKSKPIIKAVSYLQSFNVEDTEDFLFLSARPGELETEEGELERGVNCYYIDPTGCMETSGMLGYIPSRAWIDKGVIASFPTIPAYYSVADIKHTRDKRGEAIIKFANPTMTHVYSKEIQRASRSSLYWLN